jgi:hypothetical protein
MEVWGPCETREATNGSRGLRGRVDLICTRPCNPWPAEEPTGTGTFVPETHPRKWQSAIDRARKRHPIIVTAVTGTPRSHFLLCTPPGTRTGLSSCSRSWGELLCPPQFKYRACRRKFYPQFPIPHLPSNVSYSPPDTTRRRSPRRQRPPL